MLVLLVVAVMVTVEVMVVVAEEDSLVVAGDRRHDLTSNVPVKQECSYSKHLVTVANPLVVRVGLRRRDVCEDGAKPEGVCCGSLERVSDE